MSTRNSSSAKLAGIPSTIYLYNANTISFIFSIIYKKSMSAYLSELIDSMTVILQKLNILKNHGVKVVSRFLLINTYV